MRVAIDVRMIDHTGIGTAIRSWLEGFARMAESDRPQLVLLGREARLAEWRGRLNAEIVAFDSPIYSLNEQIFFTQMRPKWDLFHSPHYNIPLSPQPRLIATVHDLFHWEYGSWLKKRYQAYYLKQIRRRASRVCAVSATTRQQLIEHFRFDPNKTEIVSGGLPGIVGSATAERDAVVFRERQSLPNRYFLWMGIYLPHKNLDGLLAALREGYLENRLLTPFVFLLPRLGDRERLIAEIEKQGIAANVHTLPHISNEDMPRLFAGARALIFPSLEEGFGYPPLEAMAHGVPAAVSNRSPMKENCADAALYFDPERPTDILRAMRDLEASEELRNSLIEKGLERAREFSSEKVAARLLAAYRRALA